MTIVQMVEYRGGGAAVPPFSLFNEKNMKKVCVFVDGENFRFSLTDLFRNETYNFSKQDYLPKARWFDFFSCIVQEFGLGLEYELLRVYWYVISTIDYRPHSVPYEYEKILNIVKKYPQHHNDYKNHNNKDAFYKDFNRKLQQNKKTMQQRFEGWAKIHNSIEHSYSQIEFRRSGSIPCNLVDRSLETEKGVDTQLATDLITLADIYDVAIIISGDADYIPPIKAIKNKGKLVCNVSFLSESGKQLPGGAGRLDNIVDIRQVIPFDKMLSWMDVKRN